MSSKSKPNDTVEYRLTSILFSQCPSITSQITCSLCYIKNLTINWRDRSLRLAEGLTAMLWNTDNLAITADWCSVASQWNQQVKSRVIWDESESTETGPRPVWLSLVKFEEQDLTQVTAKSRRSEQVPTLNSLKMAPGHSRHVNCKPQVNHEEWNPSPDCHLRQVQHRSFMTSQCLIWHQSK